MPNAEVGYSTEAACAMLLFSLASSSLLLINKLCVYYFPVPAFVSTAQFLSASITAMVLMISGVAKVDHFEWHKVKPYLLYVVMFVSTIYANMRALQHSNVETIIVFRACCPLVVCILDWAFLGRELPSLRSMAALLVVAAGCAGYVATDRAFKLSGWGAYSWVSAYFVIISFEMAYGKHIVGPHLQFASMWGPTLYTNTISVPPMLAIGIMTHEQDRLANATWTTASISLLVLSLVVGVAISYLGWRARSLVTATCYTVLGVANKMLTVLANAAVWDQRASLTGIMFLCVCLVGAGGYKQAPLQQVVDVAVVKGRSRRRGPLYALAVLSLISGIALLLHANSTPLPPSPTPYVPPSTTPYVLRVSDPKAHLAGGRLTGAHSAAVHAGGGHHHAGRGHNNTNAAAKPEKVKGDKGARHANSIGSAQRRSLVQSHGARAHQVDGGT